MKKTLALVIALLASICILSASGLPYGIGDQDLNDMIDNGYGFQQISDTEFSIVAPYDYDYNMFDEDSELHMMPSSDGDNFLVYDLLLDADGYEDSELRFLIANSYLLGAYGNEMDFEEAEALMYLSSLPMTDDEFSGDLTLDEVFEICLRLQVAQYYSQYYDPDMADTYGFWLTDDYFVMSSLFPGEGVSVTWLNLDELMDLAEEVYAEL